MSRKQPSCMLISSTASYHGKQGLDYQSAISAETVGSKALCMHLLTIPPGAKARAHMHENHETSIYVMHGEGAMWYGDELSEHMLAKAGDFIYIPAGVPHLPYNPSPTETVVAVLARTDPNEQESVVLLPELDKQV